MLNPLPPQISSTIFHLKQELLTQFPVLNNEKYPYLWEIHILQNIIWFPEHLPQTIFTISVEFYKVRNLKSYMFESGSAVQGLAYRIKTM